MGADAVRRGELAIRIVHLLLVVVIAIFATAVLAFLTRQLPWLIACGVLLLGSPLLSHRALQLARGSEASASSFLSQQLGYPIKVALPWRPTLARWRHQIDAAIQVHEATHTHADYGSDTPADQSGSRLADVEHRLAELRALHIQSVLATTKWVYAMLLGVAPIVAAAILFRHLPLWLLLLAVVGLAELAFCEVHVYKLLLGRRRSSSELRQLRRERRTLLPPR